MTAPDDSFPEYPTAAPAPQAEPAPAAPPQPTDTSPVTQSGPTPAPDLEAKPYESETAIPAPADPAPDIPQASTSITQEPVAKISPDITEEIVDAMTEETKIPDDAPQSKDNTISAARSETVVRTTGNSTRSSDARTKSLRARQTKRDAKLARIIEFARNRGSVRNDDIKGILRVSDATATRYARILVQRGELAHSGKGRGVTYTPRS